MNAKIRIEKESPVYSIIVFLIQEQTILKVQSRFDADDMKGDIIEVMPKRSSVSQSEFFMEVSAVCAALENTHTIGNETFGSAFKNFAGKVIGAVKKFK